MAGSVVHYGISHAIVLEIPYFTTKIVISPIGSEAVVSIMENIDIMNAFNSLCLKMCPNDFIILSLENL